MEPLKAKIRDWIENKDLQGSPLRVLKPLEDECGYQFKGFVDTFCSLPKGHKEKEHWANITMEVRRPLEVADGKVSE